MKRQKSLALLLALTLLLSLLSACSSSPASTDAAPSTAVSPPSDTAPAPQVTTFATVPETSPATSFPVSSSDDDAQLQAYLDGLVAALNDVDDDTLHYYSLSEDGVFYTISMPSFDSIYDNLDSLSASDLSAARNIALDFVSGEFAEDLIAHIRANGGASKAVYITLGCSRGICMASCDLSVFMDELKR